MTENIHPIRTGLCAYGMSGQVFHAPFLHCMPEFSLAAVVERHQKKAAIRYPGIHTYNSIEEMLADHSLELIVVDTPNTTHYDYAKKALEAGKHVIVEKPFAPTFSQAKELVDLAGKMQRFLTVFQNRRWDSDFLTVREVIEKKLLGTLIEAEMHYDRYRLELNDQKKHKEKPGPGVGNIYDLGPHLIDQAIVLFGKPRAVFSIVQTHRPDSLVDDYFEIKLLYDGFTCTLKSSLLVREALPAYIIHGETGSFVKSRSDIQEAELQKGLSPCTPGWGEEPAKDYGTLHTEINHEVIRQRYPSLPGDYKTFYKQVYASLYLNASPPVPLADSLLNIQIIEAALQSSREKIIVEL
jgi:predicted dehydrogenase